MIDEKEFYRRFDQIVPGPMCSEDAALSSNSEIYFERLSMAGLEEMNRYSLDERMYEFFEFDPFDTIEKTKAYINKLLQRMSGDIHGRNAMYWFVRRKSDGYLVGTACLVGLNYSRKSIEWGYGIDPELWGGGYILKIQDYLKRYVFEILDLNRLHGVTMVENSRTIASLLATGMRHEGILRDFYCKDGIFRDAWQYSMLKREYYKIESNQCAIKNSYSIEDVIGLVSSVLTDEEVTIDTSMDNSPSWDSFSHMSIMIAISERVRVNLSPSEVMLATSVKDIYSLIAKVQSGAS
jgi:ribosomal-protein-alanine N-acetyltransferase